MKKIVNKFILVIAAMAVSSCDFLDLKPEHSFVNTDMLVKQSDAVAAVNGIYTNILSGSDDYAGGLFVSLSCRAGYSKYLDEDYDATYKVGDSKNVRWTIYYTGVNYANFAINGIANMDSKAFAKEEDRIKLIAEARLLRAWFNIFIFNNFAHWWEKDDSPYGIIYRDKISALDNIRIARLSVGESYTKIIEDLDEAIANCPTLAEFGSNKKMSKEYAKVLKAKLLLMRGTSDVRGMNSADLTTSLGIVNELLSNLPKEWTIEGDMVAMYKNSFDSKENLFVRYNKDWNSSSAARNTAGFVYGYGTAYAPGSANTTHDQEGNPIPHDPAKFDAGLNAKNLSWIKADPRWPLITGIAGNAETWDNGRRFMVTKLYRGGYNNLSECDFKYNVYYFRLYELYLMKAELILRTGGAYTDAMAVLNSVRAKRTNPVLPALTATSNDEAYDLIFKEIFCELFWENGAEYYASLRFKSPDGDKYIEYNKKDDGVLFDWNKQCFPIPDSELGNNKFMEQNNGY